MCSRILRSISVSGTLDDQFDFLARRADQVAQGSLEQRRYRGDRQQPDRHHLTRDGARDHPSCAVSRPSSTESSSMRWSSTTLRCSACSTRCSIVSIWRPGRLTATQTGAQAAGFAPVSPRCIGLISQRAQLALALANAQVGDRQLACLGQQRVELVDGHAYRFDCGPRLNRYGRQNGLSLDDHRVRPRGSARRRTCAGRRGCRRRHRHCRTTPRMAASRPARGPRHTRFQGVRGAFHPGLVHRPAPPP